MGWSTERKIVLVCLVTLLAATPAKSSSDNPSTLSESRSVNTEWKLDSISHASETHRPTEELTALSEGDEEDLEREAVECSCPGLETTFVCNCTAQRGFIVSPTTGNNIEVSYYIEAEDASLLSIYFTKKNVPSLGSTCTLTFGDVQYSNSKQLQKDNLVYIDAGTPIKASGYFPSCTFKLNYTVYAEDENIIYIDDISGTLVPPEDPTGDFNYLPNARHLWIFRPNVTVTKFNFIFNSLDLGSSSNVIHGSDKVNKSEGDFLLIGPGEDVLGGSEVMFYGKRDPNKIRQVVTLGGQSHIYFYSYGNSFNATGFNISFVAEEIEETTTEPSTTGNPLPPENLETYTVTAINGVKRGDDFNINVIIDDFKNMTAEMANEYLILNNETSVTITSKMVIVEDVRGCRLHCDQQTCVSFNFSVAEPYPNGSWIFTKSRLDDMMQTEEVLDKLDLLGENCEICIEPVRNMGMYVGIPVAIVVIACIISMAFWFLGARDHQDDAKLKYEQEIADRMDDNRRRSSCDNSILGVGGGSIASRGTLNSRRFTMPFPKAKRTDDEDDVDAIDMSGYKEYDPDVGRVDPSTFGIHKEFLSDKTAVKHYTNEAFVDEDENETTLFRRDRDQQQETVAAGTDSEDSEGGAVSFEPRKKNISATPVTTTVEIHRPEHLSLQRSSTSSGNNETAL